MKKINLILVLLIIFTAFTCMSSVASAISLNTEYVGNTIVDLSWSQYWRTDFSEYVIHRDGSPITAIADRSVTFYRDSGLTKGVTYTYEIHVYNATGKLVDTGTTSAKAGDVHGEITIDTNWTASSGSYDLSEMVTVSSGATLNIESGTIVNGHGAPIPPYACYLKIYGDKSPYTDSKDRKLYAEGVLFNHIMIDLCGVNNIIKRCTMSSTTPDQLHTAIIITHLRHYE